MRYQLARAIVLLCFALPFLSGCSDAEPSPPGTELDATLPAAALEPGDARFLLGHGNVIDRVTLTGQVTNLLTLAGNVNVLDMSLSEDRQQLAFVVELPAYTNDKGEIDFGADLFVSDADGGNARRVLRHANTGDYFEAPAWLNDTTLLVGSRGFDPATNSSFSRIERVDIVSGSREVVLRDSAMGALSPDRHSIVYTAIDPTTRVQRLVIEDIVSNDAPRVLVDEFDGLALFSAVAFSPDSSAVAFAAVDLNTAAAPSIPAGPRGTAMPLPPASALTHPFAQDIWLVNTTDGSDLHRIADIAENMPSISWSGNGRNLFVLGPGFLWRLNAATGDAEMLRQSGERGAIIWLEGS